MSTFNPGDRVAFYSRGRKQEAEVIRVNAKSLSIRLADGRLRRLPASRFHRLEAHENNVIPFPVHACGIGTRVWFRGDDGLPVAGIIVGINAHSAQVRPDDGSAAFWRVTHHKIRRLDQELPKRPDDVVLHEIARCYARLERAWNPDVRPHMRRQVNRRLNLLFRELGRHVPRQEALAFGLNQPKP